MNPWIGATETTAGVEFGSMERSIRAFRPADSRLDAFRSWTLVEWRNEPVQKEEPFLAGEGPKLFAAHAVHEAFGLPVSRRKTGSSRLSSETALLAGKKRWTTRTPVGFLEALARQYELARNKIPYALMR